jgi:hypothetical protein
MSLRPVIPGELLSSRVRLHFNQPTETLQEKSLFEEENLLCQLRAVSMEGFTPFACGQFVDRIASRRRVADCRKWDGM